MIHISWELMAMCCRSRLTLHLLKRLSGQTDVKACLCTNTDNCVADQSVENSPAFRAIAPDHPPKMASEGIVPGKGPPPEEPVNCCMSGCANCVWIQYAEDLTDYYKDGGQTALKELDKIENLGLKAFIKLELGL